MNDTTRTFPRTIDEAKQANQLWHGLDADEANPFKGPYDCHGPKHKQSPLMFIGVVMFVLFAALVSVHLYARAL